MLINGWIMWLLHANQRVDKLYVRFGNCKWGDGLLSFAADYE